MKRRAQRRKYHYIYKTTCTVTKRYYIGMHSTDDLSDGYIGSGKRLWYSINKHRKENHIVEILEFLSNRKELKKREGELVNEDLLKDDLCMNIMLGGIAFDEKTWKAGAKRMNEIIWKDKEFRKRHNIRKSVLFKELHDLGKIKAPDWTGKTHTEETKHKMSEAGKKRTGNKNSQYGTCWICKNKEVKKIKKEDLPFFLENGWKRGRK